MDGPKVNIIIGEKDQGWILGRVALELQQHLGWSINEEGADIDLCIPYLNWPKVTAKKSVGLYTHLEAEGPKRTSFLHSMGVFTQNICLSNQTANILRKYKQSSEVIHLGSSLNLQKLPRFGVVGRVHKTGRKGEHLVKKIVEAGYDIRALGKGWPCSSVDSNTSPIARMEFYQSIDYLIVTSTIEGGPVPVLDAIAMNIPVIAPDVGWCWEYPVIRYTKGDWDSLNSVLSLLSRKRTWEDVANDFNRVIVE